MNMKINNSFHAIVPDSSGSNNGGNNGTIKSPQICNGLNTIKRNDELTGKQNKDNNTDIFIDLTPLREIDRFWTQKRKEAWADVPDEVKNVDDKFSCFMYAIGNIAGIHYDEETKIGLFDYDKQANRYLNQYAEMYDEVNKRYDEGSSYYVIEDGKSRSIDRLEALHGLSLKLEQKLTSIDINRMGSQECLEEYYKELEKEKVISNPKASGYGRIIELMDETKSNINLVKRLNDALPESLARVAMDAAEEYVKRKKEGTDHISITDIFNGKL